jgi:hypothetical protein
MRLIGMGIDVRVKGVTTARGSSLLVVRNPRPTGYPPVATSVG